MAQMSNKKLEDNVINFTTQVDSQLRQTEAAAKGLQYEWQNGQDNSVLAGALAANRSGSIAVYTQALREMGKTMTNEEFEAATGVKLEDTKYETAADFTAAMAKDVKKYSDTVDGIRRKVRNLPDPLMYEKGSKDRLVATIMHNAQEEAIRIIALNALKAGRAAERSAKLAQELLQIPSFANSAEYAMRVLTNPEMFKGETGNMLAEIKVLEESLNVLEGDQKKAAQEKIKDKKRLVEVYNQWLGYWDNRDQLLVREDDTTGERGEITEQVKDTFTGVPMTVDEYDENGVLIKKDATVYSLDHKDMVETFREFLYLKNKELGNTTVVSEEDLRQAFDKIVDFIRLDKDAKDYMRAMDMMYNPDYYRAVLTNIQDGRFKYELLEFVDSVNEKVSNAILYTVMNSDLNDEIEKLMLASKLYEQINKKISNSEYYKNLVLITVDEKLGLDNAKFAQENVEKLNVLIQDTIAEILDKYAPNVMSNEISDEDYQEFQRTKKVSGLLKTIIARKLASEETLTDRQSEVYKAFEEEINNIVDRLKATPEAVSDDSRLSKAKDALVETGEFDMETLNAMSQDDIFKLALERNLITEEEIAEEYTGKAVEVITDDVYNNFKNTGEVEEGVLESIARRDMENIELTDREKEIMQEYLAEITDIQDYIEEELERNEEETGPIVDPEEEEIPQVLEQEDDVEEKTTDPLEGANIDESQLDAAMKLMGLENTKDDADNAKEPFEVTGENETGFNVNSRNGLTVNSEPLETEEEALNLADELNTTRSDIDWATEFLGNLSEDEDAGLKRNKMVQSGKKSLAAYNKANNTEIKTLEAYSKIPDGKRNLDDIKEAIITNVPLAQVKAKRKKLQKQQAEQIDLFDDTTSGFVGGPALPLQSVQDLYDRLEAASTTDTKADIERVNIEKGLELDGVIPKYGEHRSAIPTLTETLYDKDGKKIGQKEYVGEKEVNDAIARGVAGTRGNKPSATRTRTKAIKIGNKNYKADVELYSDGTAIYTISEVNAGGIAIKTLSQSEYTEELDALEEPTVTQEKIKELENKRDTALKESQNKGGIASMQSPGMYVTKDSFGKVKSVNGVLQDADIPNAVFSITANSLGEYYDKVYDYYNRAIAALQQPTVTQEDIRKIEDELKDTERQLSALQSTEPTSEKTYQDLLNEKWPDASGYLSNPIGKGKFMKETGKFVSGRDLFEIRPIGNGQFEYRILSDKISQNKALANYIRYVTPVSEELNGIDSADTIVTVKPGILRKEGDEFIVEKEAQVFYANSSTINNKVVSAPTQSTKVKTLDTKKTKLLEDLKEARLALLNQVSRQMSEKIGKFVKEEQVSEDTILDQLRKINSCFK
jgi:hypothetical protein